MKRPLAAWQALAATAGAAVLSLSSVAVAQEAASKPVEVTGSHIPRLGADSIAPLTVITHEGIERSGRRTLSELLHSTPGTLGQAYSEIAVQRDSKDASKSSPPGSPPSVGPMRLRQFPSQQAREQ